MRLTETTLEALMLSGDLPDIASLLQSPGCVRRGAYREPIEDITWFPEVVPGQMDARAQAEVAKAVCGACDVREQCRAYAPLADDSLCGVWGGTSAGEVTGCDGRGAARR